jgi:hypothetical protein
MFVGDAVAENLDNSRFADAGLTRQEQYLSLTTDDFSPTTIKERPRLPCR